MTTRPTIRTLMENQEQQGTKLAGVSADVENIKTSMAGMNNRLDKIDNDNRDSFSRVYEKLDRISSRPFPWNPMLAVAGLLVALGTAICGGMLTLMLALAAWGNAYFSNMIDTVRKETSVRLDALERHEEYPRAHENNHP